MNYYLFFLFSDSKGRKRTEQRKGGRDNCLRQEGKGSHGPKKRNEFSRE